MLLLPAARAGEPPSLAGRLEAGLTPAAAAAIGRQIFQNEAGGRRSWLVHWLPGEDHVSLGIGHFIWYPAGRRGPFRESFVDLIVFMELREVPLPDGLTSSTPAPWPDRSAFLAADRAGEVEELRAFLGRTIPVQTDFMANRLARAFETMLGHADARDRAALEERIESMLFRSDGSFWPEGAYPLIDFVNFKGEGTSAGERYQGEGWGLLQVLEAMPPDHDDPRAAFADAADAVLTRRVALAPPARDEGRWLPGWLVRIETYRTFEVDDGGQAAGRS